MTSLRRSTRLATTVVATSPSSTLTEEVETEETLVESPAEDELPKKTNKKRKRKTKDDDDFVAKKAPIDDAGSSPTKGKKRGARKPKEPIVYDIPDVEHRQTTFTGRLGYACLNTVLRDQKPAYNSVFCSRTCRIDTMKKKGMRFVKELGKQNLKDMLTIIKWNEEHNIRFMRLSSNIFPFASHGQYGYSLFADESADDEMIQPEEDAEDAEPTEPSSSIPELLAQVGALARSLGHRLTSHPGQFVQLGSASEKVRASSIRELVYHTEMMEGMGLDQDSVMIVHGGGTYGNKSETLERIKRTIKEELPANVRARLVLENDEMCYAAEDLLPLCEELDVPLVFDYHHHNLNPSSKGPVVQDEVDNAEVSLAADDSGAIPDPEDGDGEGSQAVDQNQGEQATSRPRKSRSQASQHAPAAASDSEATDAPSPTHSEFIPETARSSPTPSLVNPNPAQTDPSAPPPTIAQILARTNAIFKRRGIRPKQHLSEPRKGAVTLMERRAHADRCARMPEVFDEGYEGEPVDTDVDLMIEAKDKEQAVFHLYRVYGLAEVKRESLRPAREETKHTQGRKSNKRAKAKKDALDAEAAVEQADDADDGPDERGVSDEDAGEPLGSKQEDSEAGSPVKTKGRKIPVKPSKKRKRGEAKDETQALEEAIPLAQEEESKTITKASKARKTKQNKIKPPLLADAGAAVLNAKVDSLLQAVNSEQDTDTVKTPAKAGRKPKRKAAEVVQDSPEVSLNGLEPVDGPKEKPTRKKRKTVA